MRFWLLANGRSRVVNKPRLDYVPREDATPEGELAALAAVFAFVIQAHERKKAAASPDKDRKQPS